MLTVLPTYCWDKGVFPGESEVGVGPTPLSRVSRQGRKTRWLKSDKVTLWHVKQRNTRGTSTTYEESTPRYLLRPNYFIIRTKIYIIYTHYSSGLRWRRKQARKWKRRQQQRQRRRRELELNLQKAQQPQPQKIFDSTLGYPGEGPGNVQGRRTGTLRQEQEKRHRGSHVYHTRGQQQRGGGCRRLSVQHPQQPSLFDSTLGYPGEGPESTGPSDGSQNHAHRMDNVVTQGHHRGRYYKKKKYWDRGSESMWRPWLDSA